MFCIFLFMCSTTLFGALVSELNEIVVTATFASKELDDNLEAYSAIKPRRRPYYNLIIIIIYYNLI